MNQPIAARRAFGLFLLARVFTSLSFQMAGVAVGWLVYARTGSAYNLGLVGLAQFLPMVALTFVVGPLADRVDRRRIVAGCEILNVATLVVLALGAASDWLTMPVIFAAVALLGAARAFEHPSMSALLPNIVGESDLPRAVAFSSSAMQTATIIGPALGGPRAQIQIIRGGMEGNEIDADFHGAYLKRFQTPRAASRALAQISFSSRVRIFESRMRILPRAMVVWTRA